MDDRMKAYGVHLFTATGAVFAMLALLEAVQGDWAMMFLWLVVAFIVDGIDGPLARRYHVKHNAPTINGELLDLIIDYLTYVFIPAFALFQSGLLPGWTGWIAIIVITFTSVVYFADTRMKTTDKSFQGFPCLLEHGGGGNFRHAAGVLGHSGDRGLSGCRDVHTAEIHPPCAHDALAQAVAADCLCLDRTGRLGRLGKFQPARARNLGADRDKPVSGECGHLAANPARAALGLAMARTGAQGGCGP
jgi:hypothetical protein